MAPKPKPESFGDGISSRSNKFLQSIQEKDETTKEILCDGYFYDVTHFIKKHPGGTIIEYYTKRGEDATQAIQQFHQRSSNKVQMMLKSFKKRVASEDELQLHLDPEKRKRYRALTEDFTKLYLDLEKEGMFKPSPGHMVYRVMELIVLGYLSYWIVNSTSNLFVIFLGSALWGIVQGRTGWVQHECGHHSFTGIPKYDRILQVVIFGIGLGLSSKWWSRGHNRHHAMPQRIKHDVDMDTLPLFCCNSQVAADDMKRGKNIFIYNQAWLYLTVDTFLGSFYWHFYLHPKYAFKHGHIFQLFWMLVHYGIQYYCFGLWSWLIAVWVASAYLFGNFALSHTYLEATTEPTHWVEYALVHTADIEPSWWCDWWMGYLNYQIEHHLFPTMPQFRQRQITGRVKELAKKHGIPYFCFSYKQAMIETFKNFDKVSEEFKNA